MRWTGKASDPVKLLQKLPELLLALAVTLTVRTAVAGDTSLAVFDGSTMGTSYHIVVADPQKSLSDDSDQDRVQQAIDETLDRIDRQMSTWRDDSELSEFNASSSTEWFDVSHELALVVQEALRIARQSGGAFDPTVGPLVRLWSFGGDTRPRRIPDADEIAAARARTGWQKVQSRTSPPALRKSDPEVQVDLSAIAKGYGVDAVSGRLHELGFSSHLVEIGGEIRTRGRKPDGRSWRAGIQRPDADVGFVTAAIELTDAALATSGDYRNFFEIDGRRYSHTINPHTGRPVDHGVASVSIIANSCMIADGLATAVNVLGPERGLQLVAQREAQALLLLRTADGFEEIRSAGFPLHSPTVFTNDADSGSLLRTVLAAGLLIGLSIAGMAVGVIFSNRRIQGSCGGLANMPGAEHSPCELCTKPVEECPNAKVGSLSGEAADGAAAGRSQAGDAAADAG